MSIVALLNQIREGEIVLPAIQRDFVWPEERVERLLDSVLRGYPIGIALLWETYLDVQHRRFTTDYQPDQAHLFHSNGAKRKLKVVLDGQQRLQSLYIALYGSYAGKRLYFDVLSGHDGDDLADQRFVFALLTEDELKAQRNRKEDGRPAHFVRVDELFKAGTNDRRTLVRKLRAELNLDDDAEDRVETNLATFDEMLLKDPNILKVSTIDENRPSDSPDRKTEADVLEIFVRINREGTPLSRSDLIFSMLKLNWQESAETLPELVRQINNGNSLRLDTDFVIRCLFAVSDLGTKFDIDLLRRKTSVETLKARFDGCCKAIRSAVDFVVCECGIANAALLGGTGTLVPLVYYLFHAPKHALPHTEVERARKTLFLFAFARPFSRYAESRLWRFIRDELKPLAESGSHAFPFESAVGWVRYWEKHERLDLGLLGANVPLTHHVVQRLSGTKTLHAPNAPELDHIFPRAELRSSARRYSEEQINNVANFWILAKGKNQNKSNKHPAKYFEDVPDTELRRAQIDRDMLDYRKYPTFLLERGERLVDVVSRRTGLRDEDFLVDETAALYADEQPW